VKLTWKYSWEYYCNTLAHN